MKRLTDDAGIRTFLVVWAGQMVSLLGDSLTMFALSIWVYQETGAVTPLALSLLATLLPRIVVAPAAGVLVDRWPRRTVMLLADVGSALFTLIPAALLLSGGFQLWHVYLAIAGKSVLKAFQAPAWEASVSLLVPKEQLGRAGGMMRFGLAAGEILAPLAGAALLLTIGLGGVLLVDLATFLAGAATLLLVRFPEPPRTAGAARGRGMLREAGDGLRWLRGRPGLRGLIVMSAAVSFGGGAFETLLTPVVLERFSVAALGMVTSAGGLGFLLGGVWMTAWGGPRRRMRGVLWGWALAGAFMVLLGLAPSPLLAAAALFACTFVHPLAQGCTQALWQAKTPPEVQGRVFSTRSMLQLSTLPPAFLLAAAAADRLGPDAAGTLSLLMAGAGGIVVLTCAAAALVPAVAGVEDALPDALPGSVPDPDPDPDPAAGAGPAPAHGAVATA